MMKSVFSEDCNILGDIQLICHFLSSGWGAIWALFQFCCCQEGTLLCFSLNLMKHRRYNSNCRPGRV